jgi:hypothetical protein
MEEISQYNVPQAHGNTLCYLAAFMADPELIFFPSFSRRTMFQRRWRNILWTMLNYIDLEFMIIYIFHGNEKIPVALSPQIQPVNKLLCPSDPQPKCHFIWEAILIQEKFISHALLLQLPLDISLWLLPTGCKHREAVHIFTMIPRANTARHCDCGSKCFLSHGGPESKSSHL